jgi:hypothetical protein
LPEWLHEAGIGEERAILIDGGQIIAARIEWGEGLRPGLVAEAAIVSRQPGSKRGTARFRDGAEALVDGLTADITEGQTVMLAVTRAAIAERGRTKLAQARPSKNRPCAAPTLLEELRATGVPVRTLPAHDRAFNEAGWDELVEEALTGSIAFAGGSLTVSPTPAMTLIDIDGAMPPRQLALAAIPAIAAAMGRLDLGGSVGIDFPSIEAKAERQEVDTALAAALAGWRGERTAMNGFGFVQLVSRLERPSLTSRFALRPASAAARMLLRRAERVTEPGTLLLTAHPAVRAAMRAEWEAELARRTGRDLRWAEDTTLALAGGFAQAVPR